MKIAVVHDYFTQLGGAEQVAMQLYHLLPNADLFASVALPERLPPRLKNVPIQTSWMQKLPKIDRYYRQYFLLYPLGVESLDLSRYDLIVSSSSGYGKGVRTNRNSLHVCYCHTPMRWAWSFEQYSEREKMSAAKRACLSFLLGALRRWDLGASREPDHFIANSRTVAQRILNTYGRHAEVIHPPIDTGRFQLSTEQDEYYLVLSRLVSYKRIDLAIEACNRLKRKLLVIGEGPDRKRLEQIAGPTIELVGRLSDHQVEYHASRCRALIFPGEEDFGMAPLEVAAAGRPTIAFHGGGARETVLDGRTGVFFMEQKSEALVNAIERFETLSWSQSTLRAHAEGFNMESFEVKLKDFLRRAGVNVSDSAPVRHIAEPSRDDISWAATENLAS